MFCECSMNISPLLSYYAGCLVLQFYTSPTPTTSLYLSLTAPHFTLFRWCSKITQQTGTIKQYNSHGYTVRWFRRYSAFKERTIGLLSKCADKYYIWNQAIFLPNFQHFGFIIVFQFVRYFTLRDLDRCLGSLLCE